MHWLIEKRWWGFSASDATMAAASGLILTASFPKIDWPFLAWIAFVPMLLATKGKPPSASFKLGFLVGLVHYATLLYWIVGVMEIYGNLPWPVSWAILFLFVLYLSLYTAVFAALTSFFKTLSPMYLWMAPFSWVGLEYVRAYALSGFPWGNLGYSQHNWLQLIQISDIFGVYGLSALIVAVNAVFFELFCSMNRKGAVSLKPLLVVGLVLAGSLVYGTWKMSEVDRAAESASKRTIALIQGNVDQSRKWAESFQGETLRRYGRLTQRAMGGRPDLAVWPETALPFYFMHDETLTRQVVALVRASGTHFVVGSPSFAPKADGVAYFNSAYLLDPNGDVLGKYDKVHLVPYGEYVPLKRFFPFIGKLVEAAGNFESGQEGSVLSFDDEKLGVLICFEVIFPELARALARNGARILVNITNDAWFGRSSAPYQHLSMAVFRAVENRRALARAANTGISAFVDPVGRVLDKTPLFEEATRTRSIPVMEGETFYTRYGDLFAVICLALTCVFIGLAFWKGPVGIRFLSKRS